MSPEWAEALYDRILKPNPTAYLHDFIASLVYPMQYIGFTSHYAICKSLIDAADPPHLASLRPYEPASVHVTYWMVETRIFHMLSAYSLIKTCQNYSLNHLFIDDNCEMMAVDALNSLTNTAKSSSKSLLDYLHDADISILSSLLKVVEASLSSILAVEDDGEFDGLIQKWASLFSLVQTDVEAFLALALQFNPTNSSTFPQSDIVELTPRNKLSVGALGALRKWWYLKAVRALLTEYMSDDVRVSLRRVGFLPIIDAVKNCDPTSTESLNTFLCCNIDPLHYPNMVKCYMRKFVIPEFDILARFDRPCEMSFDLLRLIGTLSFPIEKVAIPSGEHL
jgi:hypothetical protein